MPAVTSFAASSPPSAASLPASIACCSRPRLMTLKSFWKILLLKPRFGSRRCSGVCPPSKPFSATPVRAVWP
jgi:hypothetical protein